MVLLVGSEGIWIVRGWASERKTDIVITVKIQEVSRFRFCSLLRFTVLCCIFPY